MDKPLIFEPYYKVEYKSNRHYLTCFFEEGEGTFIYPYVSKGAAEMVGEKAIKRRKLVSLGI
jgi:hypothetical protein